MESGAATVDVKNVPAVPHLGKDLCAPGQAASTGLNFSISGDVTTMYEEHGCIQPWGRIITHVRTTRDNLYRFDEQSIRRAPSMHHSSFAVRHDVP